VLNHRAFQLIFAALSTQASNGKERNNLSNMAHTFAILNEFHTFMSGECLLAVCHLFGTKRRFIFGTFHTLNLEIFCYIQWLHGKKSSPI
jgi:hypothetical protein